MRKSNHEFWDSTGLNMKSGKNAVKCQIHGLGQMAEPLSSGDALWQQKNRLRRVFKRRCRYLANFFSGIAKSMAEDGQAANLQQPKAGDVVRVKTRAEIKATLDRWNRCKGCDIMEEMYAYCGTIQRVFKRVEKFVDERDYRFKKCKGIVFLEGVFCEGTVDYGRCDRNCYFFWREEWLEKVQ